MSLLTPFYLILAATHCSLIPAMLVSFFKTRRLSKNLCWLESSGDEAKSCIPSWTISLLLLFTRTLFRRSYYIPLYQEIHYLITSFSI
ncbi:hypothetical protein F383_08206 [Gossypium arboreum]|uniref:Uncharacterized protein n=1 Tax=Gossypium arboreum TaxID=29729 RepID=A0A0B0P8W6_GOSAR|nr:hypothetical protein F383_08206 [Gossypium arboreum]